MPELKEIKKTPYDDAIEDVQAQLAELQTALQVLLRLRDGGGASAGISGDTAVRRKNPAPASVNLDPTDIRSDAFFNMTIGDAAIKFLRKWASRTPQPTRAIILALDRGGMKGKGYQTVYKILRRRAKEKKDVVNVHGDWGLPEWYLDEPPQITT